MSPWFSRLHILDTLYLVSNSCLRNMSNQVPKVLPICEVERKFNVPDDYHQRLESKGFKLTKHHEALMDVYHDFADNNTSSGK